MFFSYSFFFLCFLPHFRANMHDSFDWDDSRAASRPCSRLRQEQPVSFTSWGSASGSFGAQSCWCSAEAWLASNTHGKLNSRLTNLPVRRKSNISGYLNGRSASGRTKTVIDIKTLHSRYSYSFSLYTEVIYTYRYKYVKSACTCTIYINTKILVYIYIFGLGFISILYDYYI